MKSVSLFSMIVLLIFIVLSFPGVIDLVSLAIPNKIENMLFRAVLFFIFVYMFDGLVFHIYSCKD